MLRKTKALRSPPLISTEDLVKNLTELLDEKKAEKIICIDMRQKSSLGEYYLIANGSSSRQVGALAHILSAYLKEHNIKHQLEGLSGCDWVLIDAGSVIIHIFRPEVRAFYNLEKLWGIDLPENIPSAS